MACRATCLRCQRKFDRYSGLLILVSESLLDETRPLLQSPGHHFVLCSECLQKAIGRPFTVKDLKFKSTRQGKQWYTANLIWLERERLKAGRVSESHFDSYVKSLQETELKGGLQPKFL